MPLVCSENFFKESTTATRFKEYIYSVLLKQTQVNQLSVYTTALISFVFFISNTQAQAPEAISFTLEECLAYAMNHQAALQQASLNEEIIRKDVAVSLSEWLPRINANLNYTHNIERQAIVFPNESGQQEVRRIGTINNSVLGVEATQTIFSNGIRVAVKNAPLLKLQAGQLTTATKIDVFVNVSKAFYSLLTAQDQVQILQEDIVRLRKNVKDAYTRYQNGIADNIDYKQATILLNNALAQLKAAQESVVFRQAALKEQMGYPPQEALEISYDERQLRDDVYLDTTQTLPYSQRIEYRLLQTQIKLQQAAIGLYRWGFLPSLNAFINYNYNYFNDTLQQLYDTPYPTSQAGLAVAIPIFQGAARIRNLQIAKLEEQQLAYDRVALEQQINTEVARALATYKSAYAEWQLLQENEQLAQEVYQTVQLQYDEGIIPYLEVIQAESDLRSARLNTSNALFQLLSGKVDVLQATGNLSFND